ncbi:MAG: lysylphosphatidylglycerol synthase transmembrane domain-containing protein [Limisphaerales bacterium]
MKKLNSALLVLGLGFLAYLVWTVGPRELSKQVCALGWGVVPLILIEGLGNLAHTMGWRHCINGSGPRVPLLRLFRMAMAGFAINYLTPSASLGGEVTKAALLASTHKGSEATGSVLLDKLTGAIGHLLLAILGSLFLLWRLSLPRQLWAAMAVTSSLVAGGILAFLWMQKQGKLGTFFRWLVDHKLGGRPVQQAAHHVSAVDEALKRFYRERPLHLILAVWWHLLGHSAAIFQAGLFLWLLDQPAPFATFAAVGFLSLWFDLLTFAIPLGLGTLEGSRVVALKAVGCSALLGMGLGVSVRVAQVFWACFGLASYSLFAVRKVDSTSEKPAAPTCARWQAGN